MQAGKIFGLIRRSMQSPFLYLSLNHSRYPLLP